MTDRRKESATEKSKTVISQLVANNMNMKAAAQFAGVTVKTAQRLSSMSYINNNPEVKEWFDKVFTSDDLRTEKLKAGLARLCNLPYSTIITNPAQAKTMLGALELAFKVNGELSDNKNINVNIHNDYTVSLQEAWKKIEERRKTIILEKQNFLPAPANSGGEPINEQRGS